MTLPPRRAYRDAAYVERRLNGAVEQLVVAADDPEYAWHVSTALLARDEALSRERGGCCVVTTESDVESVVEDLERLLPRRRLALIDVGTRRASVWDTYTELPVYRLPTVGDFTELVLALDDAAAVFDGDGSLLFHSLDDLLADVSVRTVLRLLTLLEGCLTLTPQLYTLDLERCSADSLDGIQSGVDTLVRIENRADDTWVRVD